MKNIMIISSLMLGALVAVASADYYDSKAIQIHVKTLAGKTITIDTKSDESIANIKTEIEKLVGVPPIEQQLYFGGVQLENKEKLSDYDVQDDCVLHLYDETTKLEEAKKYLDQLGDEKFKQLFGEDANIEDFAFHPSHDLDGHNSQSAENTATRLSVVKKIKDFLSANKDTVTGALSKLLEMFVNSRLGRN